MRYTISTDYGLGILKTDKLAVYTQPFFVTSSNLLIVIDAISW